MTKRVAAITGGFGYLGQAAGRAFLEAGHDVALIDQSPVPEGLDQRMLCLGGVNLVDTASAQAAVATVCAHFGQLDVLVAVAGGFVWRQVADTVLADWDRMYAMNVSSAVAAVQAAIEPLKQSQCGRIITIGARAADRATAGMAPYTAAKAGVARLTEALAEELAGTSVTVNAILPSMIDTPANRADMPDAVGSMVPPDDIARLMLFLASDAAAAINGALIPITRRPLRAT